METDLSNLSLNQLNELIEKARKQYEYDDEASDNNQTSYALAVKCKESYDHYIRLVKFKLSLDNSKITETF